MTAVTAETMTAMMPATTTDMRGRNSGKGDFRLAAREHDQRLKKLKVQT